MKKMTFGLLFVSALSVSSLAAFEPSKILGQYDQKIKAHEDDLNEMRLCNKHFRQSMSTQTLKANCMIFFENAGKEHHLLGESGVKELQNAYAKMVILREKKLVSNEELQEVVALRNKLADLLEAKADAIDEFIELHDKWRTRQGG